jgi:hexosaminidase
MVQVEDESEAHPQLNTDESYTLTIDVGQGDIMGHIMANTVYGALRGLETFSQLVVFDFESATYQLDAPEWGAPLMIRDVPRFPHRGLMVDTARHFLPIRTLLHTIDAMSYAKLNVLHLHLSDTESFPLQFRSRPKLWDGSYSSRERYLKQDMRWLVEHARSRGIRVVPEFDVPGHAASWCVGYPEVCPSDPTCQQPLNIATNKTFELIDDIVAECAGVIDGGDDEPALFEDVFFHLGGDEVDTSCWENDSEISAWLKNHNMSSDEGYEYFVKRVASIARKHGRRPVQWSEVFDHFKGQLHPSTVVHVWKQDTNVTEVVEYGFDALINVGYSNHSWYLDNLHVPWDQLYTNEPCEGIPEHRHDLCARVLGGHGEMWGERVDASDLDSTVWPRLAAIAERLWSPQQLRNVTAALPRIETFRCLLLERGVAAAPVHNPMSREGPPGVGSCYEQRRIR